jgi:hypothetical protein
MQNVKTAVRKNDRFAFMKAAHLWGLSPIQDLSRHNCRFSSCTRILEKQNWLQIFLYPLKLQ